jgi:hypothetical protein
MVFSPDVGDEEKGGEPVVVTFSSLYLARVSMPIC